MQQETNENDGCLLQTEDNKPILDIDPLPPETKWIDASQYTPPKSCDRLVESNGVYVVGYYDLVFEQWKILTSEDGSPKDYEDAEVNYFMLYPGEKSEKREAQPKRFRYANHAALVTTLDDSRGTLILDPTGQIESVFRVSNPDGTETDYLVRSEKLDVIIEFSSSASLYELEGTMDNILDDSPGVLGLKEIEKEVIPALTWKKKRFDYIAEFKGYTFCISTFTDSNVLGFKIHMVKNGEFIIDNNFPHGKLFSSNEPDSKAAESRIKAEKFIEEWIETNL